MDYARREPDVGFIPDRITVSREQAAYARAVVAHHSAESQRLFLHVLWCQANRAWAYADGVPVSWSLICPDHASTEPVWGPLVQEGLLAVSSYSRVRRESRLYKVTDEIIDRFLGEAPMVTGSTGRADLMTGKVTTRRDKTLHQDRNGNPAASKLWREGMSLVMRDLVDLDAGARHVARLEEVYRGALDAFGASGGRIYTETAQSALDGLAGGERETALKLWEEENGEPRTAEYLALVQAQGRWRNDRAALNSLLLLGPLPTASRGVYVYRPAYEPQTSGRATAIKGQTQNASHEMQHELRFDVEGTRNYDFKSSQAVLLVELIEQANQHHSAPNLSSLWLERYVTNDDAKHAYALRAGVSVTTWKESLYANLMGSALPKVFGGIGAVAEAVRYDVPDPKERIAVYARLRDVLGELHESLGEWHDWLDAVYAHDPATSGPHPEVGRSVRNAVGHTYHWAPVPRNRIWQRKAQLAAFVLQGKEAQLVLNLVKLGPAYGFETLAHMHDGIVTMGEVPAEAVDRAAELSSIVRSDLIELVEKAYK